MDVRKGKQLLKLHETDAERPKGRAALGDRKIEQPLTTEKVEEHWQSKRCSQAVERSQADSRRAVSKRTGQKTCPWGTADRCIGETIQKVVSKVQAIGRSSRRRSSKEIFCCSYADRGRASPKTARFEVMSNPHADQYGVTEERAAGSQDFAERTEVDRREARVVRTATTVCAE